MLPDYRQLVSAAGRYPPASTRARFTHRGAIRGVCICASDAPQSSGISIDELKSAVRPDEFAVYSGSAQGQLDDESMAGLCGFPLRGKRTTSKHLDVVGRDAGDFVNAYVLGSVGSTGAVIGACATYLYNLQAAVDITRMTGCTRWQLRSLVPYVIEAYRVMGARLKIRICWRWTAAIARTGAAPAGLQPTPDLPSRRARSTLLADDALALELGANILGSCPGVYVHADGYKVHFDRIGNYLTVAKAMALTRAVIGDEGLREQSYVHAHGTGTPQNRVTESHISAPLRVSLASPTGRSAPSRPTSDTPWHPPAATPQPHLAAGNTAGCRASIRSIT